MEILYLGSGTAEGWPALFCSCAACLKAKQLGGRNIRKRTGALVNGSILLDLSPDLYTAKTEYGLDLSVIDHVFVTHQHADHFYPDILELRAPPFVTDTASNPLTVYGNSYVGEGVRAQLERCKKNRLDEYVYYKALDPFCPVSVPDSVITPLPARHSAPDSLIYLIESGGKRLLYAHDTGLLPSETMEYLKSVRLDIVSLDCNAGPIQTGPEDSHMEFEKNRITKEQMMSLGICDEKTLFIANHFSHNGGMSHDEMVAYAEADGIIIAYDGMSVTV